MSERTDHIQLLTLMHKAMPHLPGEMQREIRAMVAKQSKDRVDLTLKVRDKFNVPISSAAAIADFIAHYDSDTMLAEVLSGITDPHSTRTS